MKKHFLKYFCVFYACQGLFCPRFFVVVCFSNNYCISWRGRCSCPLLHCRSDKCSKLPEGIVPASSFPAMPAAFSSGLCGLSCWKEIGGFFLFFFFSFSALKSSSAALRMNSKQFHAIKCHCKHIRWEMFSFLLHRCTTLSCSLESCGVNLTHSCNIRFKNRTIKLRSTNYTILLPAC